MQRWALDGISAVCHGRVVERRAHLLRRKEGSLKENKMSKKVGQQWRLRGRRGRAESEVPDLYIDTCVAPRSARCHMEPRLQQERWREEVLRSQSSTPGVQLFFSFSFFSWPLSSSFHGHGKLFALLFVPPSCFRHLEPHELTRHEARCAGQAARPTGHDALGGSHANPAWQVKKRLGECYVHRPALNGNDFA